MACSGADELVNGQMVVIDPDASQVIINGVLEETVGDWWAGRLSHGAPVIQVMANVGSVADATKDLVIDLLIKTMRPEFLNRIDEIIMFRPLRHSEIRNIIRIQLKGLTKILAEQNIELEITDEALTYLSMHGYEPQFGARPLKRLIQKEIVNLLSKKIIAGDIDKAKKVIVDSFEDAIIIRN